MGHYSTLLRVAESEADELKRLTRRTRSFGHQPLIFNVETKTTRRNCTAQIEIVCTIETVGCIHFASRRRRLMVDLGSDMQVLPASSTHTHTVIFLHGRDSTAKEFAAEFLESQTSDTLHLQHVFPNVRWVFPTAPLITSKRFSCDMSQWFDMWSTEDVHERAGEQDLEGAIGSAQEAFTREARVVGYGNLVLGGISQGCAVGIHALLRHGMQLRGFIGLCGWLPRPGTLASLVKGEAVKTPVFLGHAMDDEMIGIKFGEELRGFLRGLGMDVRWEQYEDGGHWLNEPKGVDDLVEFLNGVLEKKSS